MVDDDPHTLRYVRDVLSAAGYLPVVTGDHQELSRIIETEKPRLVLLDLMLPGTDGFELMERVPELANLPIIFISGYGRDETVARALESGADDYIVKPFSPMELTARIGAALRRRAGAEPFVLGELEIDYERRLVTVAGRAVELTATEYELLRVLSLNAGRVSTYQALRHQVGVGSGRDSEGLGPRSHLHQEAPAQARRRRVQADLHLLRARGRLPHGSKERSLRRARPRPDPADQPFDLRGRWPWIRGAAR